MTTITTRFGADSTAEDVAHGVDLHGRQVIVTGGSSGLGAETARVLTAAGATVTLAVRDAAAGTAAADRIATATGLGAPYVDVLDLADPDSVARFGAFWDQTLDLLVNNAALVASGLQRTL